MSEQTRITYLSFNQDYSCFSCATNDGFKIFTVNPLREIIKREMYELGELSKVEILERSNIIAFVGSTHNQKFPKHKLIIWDDELQKAVCDLDFQSDILGFKIYRDRLIVSTFNTTYLYNLQNLQLLGNPIETFDNPRGLCELNRKGTCAMVTIGKRQGSVLISFTEKTVLPKEIQAHDGPIHVFKLDNSGRYLATASDKGTLIRVFDITSNSSDPIRIFRRGSDPALISSITFDPTSKWLCVSSNTNTIHIFPMESSTSNQSWGSWVTSLYTSEIRSTTSLKLPRESEGLKSICCFNSQEKAILVIGDNGCMYRFNVDLNVDVWDKPFDLHTSFLDGI